MRKTQGWITSGALLVLGLATIMNYFDTRLDDRVTEALLQQEHARIKEELEAYKKRHDSVHNGGKNCSINTRLMIIFISKILSFITITSFIVGMALALYPIGYALEGWILDRFHL